MLNSTFHNGLISICKQKLWTEFYSLHGWFGNGITITWHQNERCIEKGAQADRQTRCTSINKWKEMKMSRRGRKEKKEDFYFGCGVSLTRV